LAATPFHQHPLRHELLARAPQLAAIVLERASAGGKGWDKVLDLDACLTVFHILGEQESCGDLRAVIVNDSHFLAYSVGVLWFMPKTPLLLEQFLMRVDRGSSDQAMDDIEALAASIGCKGVLMATSLAPSDAALGRLYARRGYSQESTQHLKVF
jgi:hypothetical protein